MVSQLKTALVAEAETDEGYHRLEALVAARLAAVGDAPLFTTDAAPDALWAAYLGGLPPERRQHYTCSCCRHFLQRVGGLAVVESPDGRHRSPLWGEATGLPFFGESVAAMDALVRRSRVTGLFVSADATLGTAGKCAKGWTHLHGPNPRPFKPTGVLTAVGRAAAVAEDVGILGRSLAEYPLAVAEQAVRVLEADAVARAEKAAGIAKWFLDLHRRLAGVSGPRRQNLLWLAAATAPAGFCHVRNTVVSTLMDDLAAGVSFDVAKRKWAEKTHPLQYQRPTAAPTAGAIDAAERLVKELGLAPALARRAARLDDIPTDARLWSPRPVDPPPAAGGVFGHLRPAAPGTTAVDLPEQAVTWAKFARDVLPHATALEAFAPATGNYFGLTTAVDPAAPPVLQWDGLADRPRNPVSVYVYHPASPAYRWSLKAVGWTPVELVCRAPWHWQEPAKFAHHADTVLFVLAGCRDTAAPGLALFPETLRGELHGVRAVIEAHNRTAKLADIELGTANGLAFGKGSPVKVRATVRGGRETYLIDRME